MLQVHATAPSNTAVVITDQPMSISPNVIVAGAGQPIRSYSPSLLGGEVSEVLKWDNVSPYFGTSKVIIVDRNEIPGTPHTGVTNKVRSGSYDPQALAAFANTPYLNALRSAFSSGDYIVFTGTGDGRLNDSLVDAVLGIDPNKVPHENTSRASGFTAIGIWGPNGSAPHLNSISFSSKPTLDQLTQASVNFYNEMIDSTSSTTYSTASPNASNSANAVSPALGSTSQTGWTENVYSDNYYELTNTYYHYHSIRVHGSIRFV